MSSFDKTVKLACKPKAAPPKAKYLDPIIAATYSEDGAVHDVCKALAPRLREPNSVVVFKALIVLHTMIRNGATDNVLTYLSTEDVLKLRSVSTGHWEGYEAPKNMQNYALYLDARIRSYRDLKHDPIRVQTDANRDHRTENEIEASRGTNTRKANGPQRSKTIIGRKLRSMTVEKGLLRETKAVQKTIDTLLECRFYTDNLEDELNVTALRFLVKDLIVLFQALNEGVINVLEHYFEMSHVDAETALGIYRRFCKETENVMGYLGIAQKLQNLLNVPIPNLKHAPVSLVKALEEYLNDSNFEQNRIEYKTAKTSADRSTREVSKQPTKDTSTFKEVPKLANQASSSSTQPKPNENNQALVDFFSSIEEVQSPMFTSPSATQVAVPHNPFVARQSMMMTGAFPQQQQPFGVAPQMTGFMQPQQTAFGPLPMHQPQQAPVENSNHPSFASFLRPQPTGFLQPLQSQSTGSNPFRQSMMMPQLTDMPAFGHTDAAGPPNFQAPSMPTFTPFAQPQPAQSISAGPMSSIFSSPPMPNGVIMQNTPARPASTPVSNAGTQTIKPLVAHQTGSRNPFGVPVEPPPPVPKAPTLQELATGAFNKGSMSSFTLQNQTQSGQQSPPSMITGSPFGTSPQISSTNSANGAGMSNIASSFTFGSNISSDANKPTSDATGTSSLTSFSTTTGVFSSQPTGSTNATSATSFTSPLQPQTTGFAGIKAFKPTSSFGASLLESLPPIPQSSASTPSSSGFLSNLPQSSQTGMKGPILEAQSSTAPQPNGLTFGSLSQQNSTASPLALNSPPFSSSSGNPLPTSLPNLGYQPTGAQSPSLPGLSGTSQPFPSSGTGLRPQTTGGVANPFRASMYSPPISSLGSSTFPPFPPTQFGSFLNQSTTGAPAFGGTNLQTTLDASKQQNGVASLI